MSPIIELQRRMVEAGRIRAGEKGAKGEPRKLDKWRLTSRDRQRLELASERWGGEVREWEGHAGEFELYTNTDALPIMLLPGHQPTTWYEMWSKGGCQRRCDGMHETISDSSCLCGEERECKPHTRLSVLLPDLPGIGSWLLSSTGWNAAAELAGAADLLQRATAQGVLIPARLRLEQRVQVSGGQTRRFAVPVIDLDVSFRELLGGNQGALGSPSDRAALPSGYTPIAANGGSSVSLSEGLNVAETQTLSKPPRVPLLEDDDILDEDPEPPSSPPASDTDAAPSGGSGSLKPTAGQKKKIGVLLKTLRDERGKVTTEQLWAKLAEGRGRDAEFMILGLDGRDAEGTLHFGPLLADMNRAEAARLIDWFERVEAATKAAA